MSYRYVSTLDVEPVDTIGRVFLSVSLAELAARFVGLAGLMAVLFASARYIYDYIYTHICIYIYIYTHIQIETYNVIFLFV